MSPRSKTRTRPTRQTWYMHTLDGMPAVYCAVRPSEAFLAFNGVQQIDNLAASLRQIRREQDACISAALLDGARYDYSDTSRYGYIRVRVPRTGEQT